jgi:hypothetical protein
MGTAHSRSGSARVSVLAIADSAAGFYRAGAPPATGWVSHQNQCRQAMRLSYNGFEL